MRREEDGETPPFLLFTLQVEMEVGWKSHSSVDKDM